MARRLAAFALLAAVASAAPADEPGKALTLRWFGQSMFQLETAAGKRVVFDPHSIPEFGRPVVKADVVCVSHLHSDHTQLDSVENVKAARVFLGVTPPKKGKAADWAKVDEKVGPIRVRTVGLFHDPDGGLQRGKVSAFIVEVDGVKVCHLGDLGHDLTPEQVKAIGPVDVLLVPVGGVYTLNGDGAKRAVAALKPARFVVPMHYGVPGYDELISAEEFLDGTPDVQKTLATNELRIPVEKPAAGAKAVTAVLGWKK